jgi:hypothetical protein
MFDPEVWMGLRGEVFGLARFRGQSAALSHAHAHATEVFQPKFQIF